MSGSARTALPIDSYLLNLEATLRSASSCVLVAETGAGKTSRVPPALASTFRSEGTSRILLLEPRRIAARAAARRIAQEQGWTLGDQIGYQVRFDRCFSPSSRIVVVTEGILLGWLQADPFLEGVTAVVLDEFHERRLDSDLALGLLRAVQQEARPDLRLLVMSATLDPQPVADYLGGSPILECPGRTFPVEITHRARPREASLESAAADGVRWALSKDEGDILVFLPGAREIHRTARELAPLARRENLLLVPLYGNLPAEEQDRALEPARRRKVVLATNVAESSITLPGISTVVDTGYARVQRFDTACSLDRLELTRISRASADQRAGRAGRLGPGRCLRLWSEHEHRGLPAFETSEVQRVDLAAAVLQLAAWGEPDPHAFPWFETPAPLTLEHARELLVRLGALTEAGITPLGRKLVGLPVPPRLGRLLVESHRRGIPRRGALAAALLAERSPFRPNQALSLEEQLEALEGLSGGRAWSEAMDPRGAKNTLRVRDQLVRMLGHRLAKATPNPEASSATQRDPDPLLQALASAFPDRVARRRPEDPRRGVLVGGRGVRLARGCPTPTTELFLCLDLDAGRRGEQSEALVRMASELTVEGLPEAALREVSEVELEGDSLRVVGYRRTYFEDLIVEERSAPVDAETAARALAQAAAADVSAALPLEDPAVAAFLARLRWLRQVIPDLDLPAFDDEELGRLLPSLTPGCRSFADLRRVPLLASLEGSLGYEKLSTLDRLAPERLEVPSGSRIRLRYRPGEPPILAARIQELFGLAQTPRLAAGRVPVLLHLLAPNRRPQQITDDLASFWQTTYHEVRKELQGRYPKHDWPQDPLSAQARRSPRRRPG